LLLNYSMRYLLIILILFGCGDSLKDSAISDKILEDVYEKVTLDDKKWLDAETARLESFFDSIQNEFREKKESSSRDNRKVIEYEYYCDECGNKILLSRPYQCVFNVCKQGNTVASGLDTFCSCQCGVLHTTKEGFDYSCD